MIARPSNRPPGFPVYKSIVDYKNDVKVSKKTGLDGVAKIYIGWSRELYAIATLFMGPGGNWHAAGGTDNSLIYMMEYDVTNKHWVCTGSGRVSELKKIFTGEVTT